MPCRLRIGSRVEKLEPRPIQPPSLQREFKAKSVLAIKHSHYFRSIVSVSSFSSSLIVSIVHHGSFLVTNNSLLSPLLSPHQRTTRGPKSSFTKTHNNVLLALQLSQVYNNSIVLSLSLLFPENNPIHNITSISIFQVSSIQVSDIRISSSFTQHFQLSNSNFINGSQRKTRGRSTRRSTQRRQTRRRQAGLRVLPKERSQRRRLLPKPQQQKEEPSRQGAAKAIRTRATARTKWKMVQQLQHEEPQHRRLQPRTQEPTIATSVSQPKPLPASKSKPRISTTTTAADPKHQWRPNSLQRPVPALLAARTHRARLSVTTQLHTSSIWLLLPANIPAASDCACLYAAAAAMERCVAAAAAVRARAGDGWREGVDS